MTNNSTDRTLHGVGGWLGILVFVMIMIVPFANLGQIWGEYQSAEAARPDLASNTLWLNYKQISETIVYVSAATYFVAGLCLGMLYKPISLRIGIIALWLGGPVTWLARTLVTFWILGSSVGNAFLSQSSMGLVISIAGAVLWTAYLLRSVRVRNTYAQQLESHAT